MINGQVKDILKNKGVEVQMIASTATVYEALQVMAKHNIGAIVVVDPDKVVGIFSERDYARRVELKGMETKKTLVSEVMTKNILYVSPLTSVAECMALMTEKHIRHLPVFDAEKLVGFISIGDIVKSSLDMKDFTIQQLEHYICGGPCPI